MLELGGLLLVGRLVGKKNFILSKKLDQVGGRGKVSVTWSYQAQILEKQLPPYNGRRWARIKIRFFEVQRLTNTTWKVVFAIIIFSFFLPQSTYIPRVPQCMSHRPNWDPHPLSCERVCPSPRTKGGTHLPAGGWGGPQFGRLKKKPSTLSTLCLFLEAFAYCGRRLEGWPNTAARLTGWRRVTQQGVILYVMDGPCRLPFMTDRTTC